MLAGCHTCGSHCNLLRHLHLLNFLHNWLITHSWLSNSWLGNGHMLRRKRNGSGRQHRLHNLNAAGNLVHRLLESQGSQPGMLQKLSCRAALGCILEQGFAEEVLSVV